MVYESSSPSKTESIAADLARDLPPGAVLALHGQLGAGKTQFVRGLLIGLGPLGMDPVVPVYLAVITTALGVFALRGLYFAIMEEGKIPMKVTGTAVGVASVVGFLPDVYMGPVMGVLLDDHPGVRGHQFVFLVLAGFALLGLLATWIFRRVVR